MYLVHLWQHVVWTAQALIQQMARRGFGGAAVRGALKGMCEHARDTWRGKRKQQQPHSSQPELATPPTGHGLTTLSQSWG